MMIDSCWCWLVLSVLLALLVHTWRRYLLQHGSTVNPAVIQRLLKPRTPDDCPACRQRAAPPLRSRAHGLWLWLAVDPLTKLVPVLHLGARTQDAAHAVIHDLRQRLAPGCLPVFTSDGFHLYFYALTAHFGQWVAGVGRRARQWQVAAELIYGQVKKVYRRRQLVRVMHVMRCGTWDALRAALMGFGLSGRLNIAFVERSI